MAEVGTKRQREQEQSQSPSQSTSLTPSERTEGRTRQSQRPQGMERYQQGRYTPSVFSVSPGEFFTLSPITLMRRFTEDIDRAFGLASGRSTGDFDISDEDIAWTPTVEVRQQGDNLLIRADLPGLSENDISVEVTDDGLVIQGERRREQTVEDGGIIRSERVYGRFYRLIPLPDDAKVEDAKANFQNGVLEITVPVPQSERQNRQIPVGASSQSGQAGQSSQSSQSSTSDQGSAADRSRAATSGR
ncbi:MAG: heat shock protein Hsp20 [Candidatus Acidoferrum typicum]|nr:heat shock protein Hsp20 [Candidatus Acidoferrum typicum]